MHTTAQPARSMTRRIGRGIGVMSIAAGIAVTGASTSAHAVGDAVPLNNDNQTASVPTGTGSCHVYGLDETASYWHLMLTPNTYAFESITLKIGGSTATYMPGDYDTNGLTNQAFIKVPMGKKLGDLSITGSSANVTPDPYSGNVQFVLSNECTAAVSEDTTTTAYSSESSSSSSTDESTTTSSTAPSFAAVVTSSTQLSEAPISQPSTPTTQPAQVGSQGAAAPQNVALPATGSHTGPGLAIGFALLLAGLFLSVFSRRRPARSEV